MVPKFKRIDKANRKTAGKKRNKKVYKITAVPVLVGHESETKNNKTRIKPNSFSRNRMHLRRAGSLQTGPKEDNKDASITRTV